MEVVRNMKIELLLRTEIETIHFLQLNSPISPFI